MILKKTKIFIVYCLDPSFAVQGTRELTQLQSILQNQIERFGNHIFQEGTLVILMELVLTVNIQVFNYQQTFVERNN